MLVIALQKLEASTWGKDTKSEAAIDTVAETRTTNFSARFETEKESFSELRVRISGRFVGYDLVLRVSADLLVLAPLSSVRVSRPMARSRMAGAT